MAGNADVPISRLTIPISMVTMVIGGAAWLSRMHNDSVHLAQKVERLELDLKQFKDISWAKQQAQGELIAKIDGKLDLMLSQLGIIQRRLNSEKR